MVRTSGASGAELMQRYGQNQRLQGWEETSRKHTQRTRAVFHHTRSRRLPAPKPPRSLASYDGPRPRRTTVQAHASASAAQDLDADVEMSCVPGVLSQHVETDPLEGRRVVREPTSGGSSGGHRMLEQDSARPLTHGT